MADVVGSIYLDVKPRDDGFAPSLQRIIDKAERSAGASLKVNTDDAQQAIAGVRASVDNVGQSWLNAGARVAGYTAAVFAARGVLDQYLSRMTGLFDGLQKAQAGFSAILGQEKGFALLDEIRQFAKESPFVTEELVGYSQQLLGVGQSAKTIVPLLRSTGDLISSLGGDTQNISRVLFTLTQIRSVGKLTGQDALQLQSALIPITKLIAEFTGKSLTEVKKLQEQGLITADTVFAAINAAGQKVNGAMAEATKTIGGARAVLSDTVKIAFQNSPALRKVYDDTVQGILKLAASLGDPKVSGAFEAFLSKIGTLYEGIKPIFSALAEGFGSGGLSSLKIVTFLLGTLSTVLSAIPEPALKSLGLFLAAMATLRAPTALLKYVDSIKQLSQVFTGAGKSKALASLGNEVSDAIDKTSTAADGATSRLSRYQGALSAAAIAGGLLLQSQKNQAAQTAGGALAGAGIGLQVGASFGPAGAAIGAGVGALGGGLLSYFQAEEQRAKDHAAKMRQLGAEAATNFIAANDATYSGQLKSTESRIKEIEQEIKSAQDRVSAAQSAAVSKYVEPAIARGKYTSGRFTTEQRTAFVRNAALGDSQGDLDQITQAQEELSTLQKSLREVRSTQDEVLRSLSDKIPGVLKDFFDGTTKVSNSTGELYQSFVENTVKSSSEVEKALGEVGLTLEDLRSKSAEELELIFRAFYKLRDGAQLFGLGVQEIAALTPTSLRNMLNSFTDLAERGERVDEVMSGLVSTVTVFATALDSGKKKADEYLKPFETKAASLSGAVKAVEQLRAAINGVSQDAAQTSALSAVAGVGTQILSTADTLYAAEYAKVYEKIKATSGAQRAETAATAAAQKAANELIATSYAALQNQLGLTEEQFQRYLVQTGNAEAYNRAIATSGRTITATFANLATQLGVTNDQLATLLNLQGKIDPNIQITVTADVAEAIARLAAAQAALKSLTNVGKDVDTALEDRRNATSIVRSAQAAYDAALASIGTAAAVSSTGGGRPAAGGGSKGGGGTKPVDEFAQKLEQAGNALESALQAAAQRLSEAFKQWTSSIKERTQYEAAISTGKLTRNAARQAADLIELNAGFTQLKASGLTEAAISALGIDSVTDLKQVRKLLKSSPGDLTALSAAVTSRDAAANAVAQSRQIEQERRTITEAIVAAAKILGVDTTTAQARAIVDNLTIVEAANARTTADEVLRKISGAAAVR